MSYQDNLSASFMTLGMFSVPNAMWISGTQEDKDQSIYAKWGSGGIELHDELVQFVQVSNDVYNTLNELEPDGCNSVWEYEVSEPFGKWFGEHIMEGAGAPSKADGLIKLVSLAVSIWDTEDKGMLTCKAMRVLMDKPKTFTPTEPAKIDLLDEKVGDLAKARYILEERVRKLEERYEGFLAGLNENLTGRVKAETATHMEKVSNYIDNSVNRHIREAFGKARDAL